MHTTRTRQRSRSPAAAQNQTIERDCLRAVALTSLTKGGKTKK